MAAGRAAETQAKISGLMVERYDIEGPGDFDGMNAEQIIAAMVERSEDPHADLRMLDRWREALIAKLANNATLIAPRPPHGNACACPECRLLNGAKPALIHARQ